MKTNWKINTKAARENIWKIVRKYLEIWKGISKFNLVIMMSLIWSLLLFSLLPTSLKRTGYLVFCYFWEHFLGAHSIWMLLFLLWVFFRFDDPDATKSHKNLRFVRDELYHCVPIIAVVKRFPYCHRHRPITVQREQFLLKID